MSHRECISKICLARVTLERIAREEPLGPWLVLGVISELQSYEDLLRKATK